MCAAEIQWLKDYELNLAKFQEEFGDEDTVLNLMTNIKPAKSLFVQVRSFFLLVVSYKIHPISEIHGCQEINAFDSFLLWWDSQSLSLGASG